MDKLEVDCNNRIFSRQNFYPFARNHITLLDIPRDKNLHRITSKKFLTSLNFNVKLNFEDTKNRSLKYCGGAYVAHETFADEKSTLKFPERNPEWNLSIHLGDYRS